MFLEKKTKQYIFIHPVLKDCFVWLPQDLFLYLAKDYQATAFFFYYEHFASYTYEDIKI